MNNQKCFQTEGIIDASSKGAWEKVGGIPLVARNLYYLNKYGVKKITVIIPPYKKPPNLKKWAGDSNVNFVKKEDSLLYHLSQIKTETVFYLDSSFLFDERIINKILNSRPNTIFLRDSSDKESKKLLMCLLDRTGIDVWKNKGISALFRKSNIVYLDDIESYSLEMRGEVKPYVVHVQDRRSAKQATWILIKSMQKKVMDLPAEYLDPLFEDHLTALLCNTPITPNMVTIFSFIVATVIAFLFYQGYFVIGAFCTYIVEILDGVDGKLARTKLEFSRFGEYECVVDYFYENLWYISLGLGLKKIYHGNLPLFLSGIMVLCDTLDNIIYTLSMKWFNKNLDLFSPFDMRFRKIAGRRNIYCFMFMIGFSLGYYLQTFIATSIWAFITVVVHTIRLIQYNRKLR
ncbi:MAG: hypothetical protein DRG27_03855 [Deltaproteobacteria bacterium]|nr:MAG: hypothetical protein DRG27_03855 [Deltaproteobacteria bacterium]